MLNFLIAIMTQTFSDNNAVKDQDALRSHLGFVLSNWWMQAVPETESTEYLITAFLKEGIDDEGDDLDKIDEKLNEIKKSINDEVVAKLF
jgi:hypothetical protein